MKIAILGATGYVGSRLIGKLSKKNEICCVVRKTSNTSEIEKYGVMVICIEDLADLPRTDVFLNLSSTYAKGIEYEEKVIESNLCTPLRVFQRCLNLGVRKTITIGTGLPSNFNIYSFSKKMFAEYGQWACEQNVRRIFYNVQLEHYYGPYEPADRFLPWVVRKLLKNESIELTEGTQRRDMIHIDDVISNLVHLVETVNVEGYHEMPLGTGTSPSIREVVEFLKEITGSTSKLMFGAVPMRPGEPNSNVDCDRMSDYGLKAEIPWKDGMRQIYHKHL